jgi:hypothetical protein
MTELKEATYDEIDAELSRRKAEEQKTRDVDWQMANLMSLYREGKIEQVIPSRKIRRATHIGLDHTDMAEIGHFTVRIKNPQLVPFIDPRRRRM